MFIKNGDDPKSKVLTIIDSDEITDDLKKSAKDSIAKQIANVDNSNVKEIKMEIN